jgi:GMP synthase (glutamine-hydrolysing)
LQIAVTAAGGRVEANVRGREFGYARRIVLTSAGRQHTVYEGKPTVFEAPTIHKDCVTQLPAGAEVLAENEMGLQAAAFVSGRSRIVGVQYHPEYDHCDIAAAARRYGAALVNDGLFQDLNDLEAYATDVDRLQQQPADQALAYRHGLGPAMTDERLRRLELSNWLRIELLPRAARHV